MPVSPSAMITPEAIQRLLMQGGNPQSMFGGDPSQTSAPGVPPTPTPGTPSATSGEPTAAPPAGAIAQSMPSFQSPEDKQQYLSENPPALPPRPAGAFDGPHPLLRRILGSLFAGAAEYGGEMNHHPGQGAQFVNRWMDQDQAQRQYDAGLPAIKQQAGNTAYNQYLDQGAKAGEIEKTGAETQNLTLNNPAAQRKAQFLTQLQGDAESGKYDPAVLKAKYLRIAQFNRVNVAPDEIDQTITGTKPLGSKYTLTRDTQTQAPIELVDRQGNHYSQSNLPKDPEAQQMWNDAATAAGQKESVEEGKEKRIAGYAADRQAQAFSNQQTEQGKKAASTSIADINDAKNQQTMIEKLLSGKMNPTSQTAAMFKMIGLEQPTGAHRIMPAEIEGIEQQGGLTDRLKQKLLNWKEGDRFDPDLIPDVVSTAKILSQNKTKTANDNLESTARIYGYKAPGSDAKGRLDKPEDYQDAGAGNQQSGNVIYARDPQGQLHKAAKGTTLPKGWKVENAPAATK